MKLNQLAAGMMLVSSIVAAPAAAQIFWQSPDFRGAPLQAGDTNIGVTLPGATPAEERANWLWQLRAGLNVAKLQCTFDRTFMVDDMYEGLLRNHPDELSYAYATLRGYFIRTAKNAKDAQNALDVWGTRTYSQFSTVRAQYGFCQTASRVGKRALFATRGSLTLFAVENLRELRNSLIPAGEQYFRVGMHPIAFTYPSFEARCWDRRGGYRAECGFVQG